MKNRGLTFSEGLSKWILQIDGGEEIELNSKNHAYGLLDIALDLGKISREEADGLKKDIAEAKGLLDEDKISDNMKIVCLTLLFVHQNSGYKGLKFKTSVDSARLEVCKFCGKHAVIHTKNCSTKMIFSKKLLFEYLDDLKKIKWVSKDEWEKIKNDIEKSLIND